MPVAVDGKIIGNAPTAAAVEAGENKIAVRAEGFEASETVAIVAAGEHKVLDMALYSSKPITRMVVLDRRRRSRRGRRSVDGRPTHREARRRTTRASEHPV